MRYIHSYDRGNVERRESDPPCGAGWFEVVTKLFSVTVKEKSTINPTELTLRIFANCGAVLSGVEERLRQIGCPKHIRDAL
jgi:hypothetical protein